MYFECAGEASVSDSESLLNRGTEPIIRFCLGYVLKLGFVLPVSIMGMGLASRFLFLGFQEWNLKQTNLDLFIKTLTLTF